MLYGPAWPGQSPQALIAFKLGGPSHRYADGVQDSRELYALLALTFLALHSHITSLGPHTPNGTWYSTSPTPVLTPKPSWYLLPYFLSSFLLPGAPPRRVSVLVTSAQNPAQQEEVQKTDSEPTECYHTVRPSLLPTFPHLDLIKTQDARTDFLCVSLSHISSSLTIVVC